MKRIAFIILAGALLVGTAAHAQQKSSKKKVGKVTVDTLTCPPSRSGGIAMEDLMREMHRRTADFSRFMRMMEDMPAFDFPTPPMFDSLLALHQGVPSDSLIQKHRRMMRQPRMHANRFYNFSDTTGGTQSIAVITQNGKTTIIKNGKDTTVVDGPFVPERDMPEMNFDLPAIPPLGGIPRWDAREFDRGIRGPSFSNMVEPEQPSVQENEMLVKKGLVAEKELKGNLDILNLSIQRNPRNETVTISYILKDTPRSDLQVVGPEGNIIEKASLSDVAGAFKRTVKMSKNLDYFYVIIGANGKAETCKFWL